MASGIALFEDTRRDAVRLWPTKIHLWKVGQEKFYKTSKEFKALDRLCWWDPTSEIRCLADSAACRFADRHGDALFRRTVDGQELHAVTSWFYGTLPEPILRPTFNRMNLPGLKDM